MANFKRILLLFFISLYGKVDAQQMEYKEIQISQVISNHKKYYNGIMRFNLSDSTFWHRKNENRKFKKLDKVESNFFLDKQLYSKLDSLIDCLSDINVKEPRKKNGDL